MEHAIKKLEETREEILSSRGDLLTTGESMEVAAINYCLDILKKELN